MRSLLPRSLLAALVAVFALAQEPKPGLTPAMRQLNIDSFEQVWRTIRDQHWDPKLGGLDWDAVHKELRPAIEKATTMAEARAVMSGMLSRLHQSHFAIIPSDVYTNVDDDKPDGRTGLDLRVIGGKALVTRVEPDSPAALQGVHTGWEIVQVGGNDVAPVIQSVDAAYAQSTLRDIMLARAVFTRLNGPIGTAVRVRFREGSARDVDLEIPRAKPKGVRTQFGNVPPQWVWIDWRKLNDRVGYVALNMFFDPARLMPVFEDALKSFGQTRGIVIDLRGNPGGIGLMAMGMAGWLIDRDNQLLGTMYMRQTSLKFVINPRLPYYGGRVAILVDGGSGSTSEIFAGGLKDLGRARIFGTRTAGAALPSFIDKLPNGDAFQFATANYISEGGRPLEGIGVIPDVEVAPAQPLLLAGHDAALEAAIHWIEQSP